MSLIYDNIKHICKANGVNLADIESPKKAGYISRYERRENILSLPLWIAIKVSKSCNVSIDDLVNKDIATDAKLKAVREEIERLKVVERTLADTPQTDWEKEKSQKSLCNSCIKDCDNRKRNLYTAECNRYEPQTDCGWK